MCSIICDVKICTFLHRLMLEYQYDEEGIPLRVLKQRLKDRGLAEHLSHDKIDIILRRADQDEDGHLSYEEFLELVLYLFMCWICFNLHVFMIAGRLERTGR